VYSGEKSPALLRDSGVSIRLLQNINNHQNNANSLEIFRQSRKAIIGIVEATSFTRHDSARVMKVENGRLRRKEE